MYKLVETSRFRKDVKRIFKRSRYDFEMTFEVLEILKLKGVDGVPITMKSHRLKGNYRDNWECHIKPDLLIIWIQIEAPKTIKLIRLGSHSDLFK